MNGLEAFFDVDNKQELFHAIEHCLNMTAQHI